MNIDDLATTLAERRIKQGEQGNALKIAHYGPEMLATARELTLAEVEARKKEELFYFTQNCRQEIECFVQQLVFATALEQPLTPHFNVDELITSALQIVDSLIERGMIGNLRNAYAS